MAKKKEASLDITTENLLDPNFTILKFYEERVEERYRLSLIPEFLMLDFKEPTVKRFVAEELPALLNTDDLGVISSLASFEPIYQEKTFWKQIYYWQIMIFQGENAENVSVLKEKSKLKKKNEYYIGDPNEIKGATRRRLTPKEIAVAKERAEKAYECLEAVIEGFKRCILPKEAPRRRGRPPKELPPTPRRVKTAKEFIELTYIPLSIEYAEMRKELTRKYIIKGCIEDIKEADNRIKKNKELLSSASEEAAKEFKYRIKQDRVIIQERVKKIAISIKEYAKAYGVNLSEKEIKKLIKSGSLASIAKGILAKKQNISVKTLENELLKEKKKANSRKYPYPIKMYCGNPKCNKPFGNKPEEEIYIGPRGKWFCSKRCIESVSTP